MGARMVALRWIPSPGLIGFLLGSLLEPSIRQIACRLAEVEMKLSIRIRQSERGGYVAECPSLPGCVTHGQTAEEATVKLDEAIRGYIAALNDFVPERVDREVLGV